MESTGTCRNCGDACFEYAAFCTETCKVGYLAYLEDEVNKDE
jgi:hypothetical protein